MSTTRFSRLTAALADDAELASALRVRWRAGARESAASPGDGSVPEDLRAAADLLSDALPALTHADADLAALGACFTEPACEVLFSWCAASTWRSDMQMARLLAQAAAVPAGTFRQRITEVAKNRVVEGPLLDALACAPLLGDGSQLALPENAEARARLEILIWEAGASALEIPDLGRWLWGVGGDVQGHDRDARAWSTPWTRARGAMSRSQRSWDAGHDSPGAHWPDAPGASAAASSSRAARVGACRARAGSADRTARAARGNAPRLGPVDSRVCSASAR